MKVLITGVHFTPAQAVIEELQKQKDIQILYVGRKYTLEGDKSPSAESQILPKLGVQFLPIVAGRLKKDLSFWTLISWLKIPIGFIQSFWIVLTKRPDIVVSFSGYLAVPVVFAAWLLNIPVILHDQTLVFGLASTASSYFASKVLVSFDQSYPVPKSKLIVTGNPIRKSILNVKVDKKNNPIPMILITGGNQGSHFINDLISQNLGSLTEKYFIVHQTGDSKFQDYEKLVEQKKTLKKPDNYRVEKFISGEQMGKIMAGADLVISRAGANTLLELAFLGTPTLIIPIPYVQKDEQTVNAKFFANAGLGEYMSQNGLTSDKLWNKINEMIKKVQYYKKSASQSKSVVLLDAAQKITQQILTLANYD